MKEYRALIYERIRKIYQNNISNSNLISTNIIDNKYLKNTTEPTRFDPEDINSYQKKHLEE